MGKLKKAIGILLLAATALCPLTGCAVGQRPGKGLARYLQEPTTQGWYWLYLPEDYARTENTWLTGKRWPLVVTFHGMKPFDNANRQIREWQQEADRYGFVVLAPECRSPDVLGEFPVRTVHPGVQYDEKLTVAALDEVARRVDIDPACVLSTSWSSGGYLAHYMANRHPERFTCIAPRQSNFSAEVLDPRQVPRYRDNKVGIFYTENDLNVCQRESHEAARWYSQHGFDVTFAMFKDLGHERRPSAAAAFFAKTCGATAKTPPTELAGLQVKQIPLAQLAANGPQATHPPQGMAEGKRKPGNDRRAASADGVNTSGMAAPHTGPTIPTNPRGRRSAPVPSKVKPATPATGPSVPIPPRGTHGENDVLANRLRIRVSSTIGIAPLLVNFSALVPGHLRRGSFFLWTDNGEPISNGINGQKYLTTPGQHVLEVLMTTADGKELRTSKTITVLERMSNERSAASAGD